MDKQEVAKVKSLLWSLRGFMQYLQDNSQCEEHAMVHEAAIDEMLGYLDDTTCSKLPPKKNALLSSAQDRVQSYIFVTKEGGTYEPNSEKVDNLQVLGFGAGITPQAGFDDFVSENPSLLKGTFDKVKCYKSWGPDSYQGDFSLSVARG